MRTEAEVRRYRELVRNGSQDEDATFRKRKNILTAKNKGALPSRTANRHAVNFMKRCRYNKKQDLRKLIPLEVGHRKILLRFG